jgi:hypothetical protein
MVIDELHVRVLDGAERQLTHGRVHDLFPAWSPDRSQAFVRDGSLHVMRADGTMTATHNRRKAWRRPRKGLSPTLWTTAVADDAASVTRPRERSGRAAAGRTLCVPRWPRG